MSRDAVPSRAVGEVVSQVLDSLGEEPPDLVVCFASADHVGAFEDIAPAVRSTLRPGALIGCTAMGVIGGALEVEHGPALSLFAARLPETRLVPARFETASTPDGTAIVGWPELSDETLDEYPSGPSALLMLTDPFSFPADAFLARVNSDIPGLPVIGGLASSGNRPGGNRLVLDDLVTDNGAVAIALTGGLEVKTVVSQGCRPVGLPFVVTKSDQNLIYELGGRPALERLQFAAAAASPDERDLMRRGLHIGRVVDEHRAEFTRGDFLVRTVMGGDQATGAIAVNDLVEVGQTVQFHVRDAGSADEDLRSLLTGAAAGGVLLFTCNGRGTQMFGTPNHDASVVDDLLGPLPVAGLFCAGELGPVGAKSFLHGFTASLALFRE